MISEASSEDAKTRSATTAVGEISRSMRLLRRVVGLGKSERWTGVSDSGLNLERLVTVIR
jgi:hypothetical protein